MNIQDGLKTPEIRELRSEELDEFVTLMVDAFKDNVNENQLDIDAIRKAMKKLRTPAYKFIQRLVGMRMEFYVAVVNNEIASGIRLTIKKDEIYVSDIMTHSKYRRQGFARKLLHFSFKRANELQKKKMRLDVRSENAGAVGLYVSEGFETIYHTGRFVLDSLIQKTKEKSTELIVQSVDKITNPRFDAMLDDCFPESYLKIIGRDSLLNDIAPSRLTRFFAQRLEGQAVHTYVFQIEGDESPRGIIKASQSRIEQLIRLSSPILFEKDDDLLLQVIPKVLQIETGIRGVTNASVQCSLHRKDALSKIESLGFRKVRDNLTMIRFL